MVPIVLSCAVRGVSWLSSQSAYSVIILVLWQQSKRGLPEIAQSYTCWGAFGFCSPLWYIVDPWTHTRCFKYDYRSSVKMPDALCLFKQSPGIINSICNSSCSLGDAEPSGDRLDLTAFSWALLCILLPKRLNPKHPKNNYCNDLCSLYSFII